MKLFFSVGNPGPTSQRGSQSPPERTGHSSAELCREEEEEEGEGRGEESEEEAGSLNRSSLGRKERKRCLGAPGLPVFFSRAPETTLSEQKPLCREGLTRHRASCKPLGSWQHQHVGATIPTSWMGTLRRGGRVGL